MGSGNHFVEVQAVDEVLDDATARAYGLAEGQVTVLIHSGSRGLGHQVCTDYVKLMDERLVSYRIHLPDRQLACAPASSTEGRRYLGRDGGVGELRVGEPPGDRRPRPQGRRRRAGPGGRREDSPGVRRRTQRGQGRDPPRRSCCVHRKGATRAFPAGSPEIPAAYREVGQPVFIPGSMGTRASSSRASRAPWSEPSEPSATAPGAVSRARPPGSRSQGSELRKQLEAQGIVVRCPSPKGLAEEAPFAYKDVDRVVRVVERAGLARRVVRLVPIGVVKG